MGILYRFVSAKDLKIIEIDGTDISVGAFKQKVLQSDYKSKKKGDSRGLCLGTDSGLIVINAITNEPYDDDQLLIPNHARVLIRRVPGNKRNRAIDTTTIAFLETQTPLFQNKNNNSVNNTESGLFYASTVTSLPMMKNSDGGSGLTYSIGSDGCIAGLNGEDDEDSRIKAFVNIPALDWTGFKPRRSYHPRGIYRNKSNVWLRCASNPVSQQSGVPGLNDEGGKIKDLDCRGVKRSYARMGCGFGFENEVPHEGYVCHRCNVPGHYIQHCPTNGDPTYDFKRAKHFAPPVLQQSEAAFDKQFECLQSKKPLAASGVPSELLCPLCKQVMRDAVMTGRCCCSSFCDKCIRGHLMNFKLKCVCGAAQVLTDSLIPNLALRGTIDRILETGFLVKSSGSSVASSVVLSAAESSEKETKPPIDITRDTVNKRKLPDDASKSG